MGVDLTGSALLAIFTGPCPRCGHKSLFLSPESKRQQCAWPDCSWPDPERPHWRLHRVPGGPPVLVRTYG